MVITTDWGKPDVLPRHSTSSCVTRLDNTSGALKYCAHCRFPGE